MEVNGTSKMDFPHLHFESWPFGLVPDEYSVTFMADRRRVRAQLERLLADTLKRPSAISLVWGWFGAGKSHSLKHFENMCKQKGGIVFSYTEFPKGDRRLSFFSLFQQFAHNLDWESIRIAHQEVARRYPGQRKFVQAICPTIPIFRTAMYTLCEGPSQQASDLAYQWLCAEKAPLNMLRKYGISKRIETDDDAINVFAALVKLGAASGRYKRTVWVVDEFNNLEEMRDHEAKRQILSAINTLFNRASNDLTIVLAFGTAVKDNIKTLLSLEPALSSRVSGAALIEVPEWDDENEVLEFVRERLAKYRLPGDEIGDYFPFDEDAVQTVIESIRTEKKRDQTVQLIPRTVMKRLDVVAREAENSILQDGLPIIDRSFVRKVLEEFQDRSI